MIPQLLPQERAREPILQLPHLTLLIPFEPRNASKAKIASSLKMLLRKVENELTSSFPGSMIKPALLKIKSIFNNLDYHKTTKSIAIFLTPFNEKIIYLSFPVREKVVVGRLLSIKELSYQREAQKDFFAVKLGEGNAVIYWTQGGIARPIVINSMQQLISNGEVPSLRDFMKSVDDNLSCILRAWKLPVIIAGGEDELRLFQSVTANQGEIMKTVPTPEGSAADNGIEDIVLLILDQWTEMNEVYHLKQLEKASMENRADLGMEDVWNASIHKRNNLLLIEEGFSHRAYNEQGGDIPFAGTIPVKSSLWAYDAVEKVIERVLTDGGDVVYLKKSCLPDDAQIALMRY